ncbi:MAG TPA: choice-of-anchor Q domain-containing protein [Thermoanaerobaculia bacterium]
MDVIEFATELLDRAPVSLFVYNTAVTEPVTINGPGVHLLAISSMAFESGASGSLIEDVKLVGPATSVGADLTLNRVRVLWGSTFGSGGGIGVTNANLTVSDSEISGNMAHDAFSVYPHFGGGILFNGDTAGTRTLTLTNVTLSSNFATTSGGALAVLTAAGASAVVNLTHVTVAGNRAGTSGGGVYLEPGAGSITANLKNVVFGDNIAPFRSPSSASDIHEAADTALILSHSVIESAAGFTLDSSTGNLIGSDAGLSVLGCNGSKQRTHGLELSSPAIDFVPAAACTLTIDQRGSPRPVDGDGDTVADCDAGALEDQGSGDFLSSFHTIAPCRLVDTRGAPGVDFGGPPLSFPSFTDRDYGIAGRCGVPGSASALAINATATNATRSGSIALYDPEVDGWTTPVVYFVVGRSRANNGVIPVCTDVGVVRAHVLFDYQGDYYGSVDFILDVVGYFE